MVYWILNNSAQSDARGLRSRASCYLSCIWNEQKPIVWGRSFNRKKNHKVRVNKYVWVPGVRFSQLWHPTCSLLKRSRVQSCLIIVNISRYSSGPEKADFCNTVSVAVKVRSCCLQRERWAHFPSWPQYCVLSVFTHYLQFVDCLAFGNRVCECSGIKKTLILVSHVLESHLSGTFSSLFTVKERRQHQFLLLIQVHFRSHLSRKTVLALTVTQITHYNITNYLLNPCGNVLGNTDWCISSIWITQWFNVTFWNAWFRIQIVPKWYHFILTFSSVVRSP